MAFTVKLLAMCRRARSPKAARRPSSSSRSSACASAFGSSGGTSSPVTPSCDHFGMPPDRAATTGNP